jgi:hypothetical protein
MSMESRVPTVRNWNNITNRELTWRLMVLAKVRPELFQQFMQLLAKRITAEVQK